MRAGARHAAAALMGAVALSGCGSANPTTRATAPAPATSASLTIVYYPHGAGGSGVRTWRLTCAPDGGSHPRPRDACRELAEHGSALAPARRPCVLASPRAMLRRGVPQALVSGTSGGTRVDRLVRPGCDAAAWAQLHVLLTGA